MCVYVYMYTYIYTYLTRNIHRQCCDRGRVPSKKPHLPAATYQHKKINIKLPQCSNALAHLRIHRALFMVAFYGCIGMYFMDA